MLPVIYQLSNVSICHALSEQAAGRLADQKNHPPLPLRSSPKHTFINCHMTTAMGTAGNSFACEPELFIIIYFSVWTIIYVLQLWKSSVKGIQMNLKKMHGFQREGWVSLWDPLDYFRLLSAKPCERRNN